MQWLLSLELALPLTPQQAKLFLPPIEKKDYKRIKRRPVIMAV
jgi:hypothetical protein